MLSPMQLNSSVARHVLHKSQRWALRQTEFNFIIEHIPGVDNVWVDILTRWATPAKSEFPARRTAALRVLIITEDKSELPSLQEIADFQAQKPPSGDHAFKCVEDSGTEVWKQKGPVIHTLIR